MSQDSAFVLPLARTTANLTVALLSLACLVPALIDLRQGIIPDLVSLAIALGGLAQAAALEGSEAALVAGRKGIIVGTIMWRLRASLSLAKLAGPRAWRRQAARGVRRVDGIVGVPLQLLAASLAALGAAGVLKLARYTMTRLTSLPFGPFLAPGLLITLRIQEASGVD